MSELSLENVLVQVKDALNKNGIKLWLLPYYLEMESNESEMLKLAQQFSESLNIKYDFCLAALNELQNHAIDKLQANKELKEEGLATLKIRVPCKKSSGGTKLLTIKIKLIDTVENLITLIANEVVTQNSIKLFSSGRVLDPQKSLAEQNIKNFQQILALESKDETNSDNQTYNRITKIRKDAEALMNGKSLDFFKLENKNGEAVYLPENERMSIMMALLLYEKGRAEMKKENYSDALILFLEADRELQSCQANIEKSIDNVAFLNLDIAWCYLQLKSIMQLPDAERRLTICEDNLKKSYGVNFERAQVSEKCLVLRLKLLQGILYFHQNRRQESSLFLSCAERELLELKVDEEKVETLLQMGYNANESIIALRNTYNTSIDSAVNFILERRSKFKDAELERKKQ